MLEVKMSLSGTKSLGVGVWEVELAPSDVRRLGESGKSIGAISVIALDTSPAAEAGRISFDAKTATVLNVGSTSRALIVDGYKAPSLIDRIRLKNEVPISAGDQQFLDSLEILPEPVRDAGKSLLREVRSHFPGDLKRVAAMRFQETPDNFWFVTVQPRVESILITVRGLPERFKPSILAIMLDRRPYSRFKVRSIKDVPEATRIIRSAIRK
jgi:hypothetical protein